MWGVTALFCDNDNIDFKKRDEQGSGAILFCKVDVGGTASRSAANGAVKAKESVDRLTPPVARKQELLQSHSCTAQRSIMEQANT